MPAVLYHNTHSKIKIKMGGSWKPQLSDGGDYCLRCRIPLPEVESSVLGSVPHPSAAALLAMGNNITGPKESSAASTGLE